ncbi:MAG: Flp pilus assembly complex ATPase component TadA [Candidatus Omnitrophica bacterium]|nr:Flp pilus assembly complex ATPase component TadA [Candidatus Omnitrophota bacterium]MBU4479063.1 Flp pilus assembly complex ATPase component TadA [Candidatus Omnitrophota bacterium]MCG2703094.1 Flp pilus assembly complex ATPase component TadA [Candidatus Omnitrophota bacterium]
MVEKNDAGLMEANRRQNFRVGAKLSMKYRVLPGEVTPVVWNTTHTKNLSVAGVCFESFHPLSLNTMLEVHLDVPFFKMPVIFTARIVRASEIKAGEIYGVAAAIMQVKNTDKKKLQEQLERLDITNLLNHAVGQGARSVHFSLGHPPLLRKADELVRMKVDALNKPILERMIFSLLNEDQIKQCRNNEELTTVITLVTVENTFRFRLNVYLQQEVFEAVFTFIKILIPNLRELKLPEMVDSLAREKSGLVILTGMSGSGKTTTGASIINKINMERACVITTLQRHIEYVYPMGKSVIKQREVGADTQSFFTGLHQLQYQDVDVVMLDGLADAQAIELVLDTACNGKLVFVTFSSPGIIAAIQSLVNVFAVERQYYIRKKLAESLRAIVFQQLAPLKNNKEKKVAMAEIMINNSGVAGVILEGFWDRIKLLMNNGGKDIYNRAEAAKDLVDAGLIDDQTAALFLS